jgi:hypothetical protein
MATKTDIALYTAGGLFGAAATFGLAVWAWLLSCERASERGFGA